MADSGASVGAVSRVPLTFADARRRVISVILPSTLEQFAGVQFRDGEVEFPYSTPPKGARTLIVGDSFTEGSGSDGVWSYTRVFAYALSLDDIWRCGSGSTGYVASGTRKALIDRYQNDILAQHPDAVVIAMGLNDANSYAANPASVIGAAETIWDAIIAEPTIISLTIVGPFPNGGGVGVIPELISMDNQLRASADQRGIKYISPIRDGLTFSRADMTHPDPGGHLAIGAWLAARMS